jgi:Galactocerebrosidase, C-terminal lectin domain
MPFCFFDSTCKITIGSLLLVAACGGSDVSTRGQTANNGGSLQSGTGGQSATTGSSGSSGSTMSSTGSGGSTNPAGSGGAGTGSGGGSAAGAGGSMGKPPIIPAGKAFLDDFEDGEFMTPSWIDADTTLGGMWAVIADAAGDSGAGNKVFAQKAAVSDWIIAASGDYRWTDQIVEAKAKFTSAPGSLGLFARFKDLNNYYFLYLDGSNIVLRKRSSAGGSNTSTTILKVKTPSVQGTWYTLKLSVVGSTLTGYLDDKMLVTAMDTDIPGGGIAVGTDSASAEFDDVTVTIP